MSIIPQLLIVIAALVVGVWLLVKVLMGLGWIVGNLARLVATTLGRVGEFVAGTVSDALHLIGGLITAIVFVPLTVGNIAVGRWSTANHYGKALEREALGIGRSAYRLVLGNPSRLLGVTSLTEGIERRLPEALARAPGPDTPGGKADAFEGYTVVGSLPAGGSGAKLFLAEPSPDKQSAFAARGVVGPHKVVIKSFSLAEGSTMPQIVRESRALEAARSLGLVLEHELAGTRFHYVMPYVPGEDLNVVTQRLHAQSGGDGLGPRQLDKTLGFTADLLQVLHRFHTTGLWHKDVKPSNILVCEGRVHVVDLGLITPLSSAMTLTTHGTEYFRDPELVRLALRGVKVNEVDGVKFDIYATGAVLYSMLENSFPAHGSLSKLTRRCPEALRWIVRRAMADIDNRYGSAVEMLADVRAVIASRDPFSVKPAALPSFRSDPSVAAGLAAELAHADAAPLPPKARPARHASKAPDHKHGTLPASGGRGRMSLGAAAAGLLVASVLGFGLMTLVSPGGGAWSPQAASNPTAPQRPMPRVSSAQAVERSLPALDWLARRPTPSKLLLIDEIPAAVAADQQQQLDALFKLLAGARFELVSAKHESSLAESTVIELLSDVRVALGVGGLSDPRDPATIALLQEFVDAHAGQIDGVLWLGRHDEPGQLAYQVVADAVDRQDVQRILQPSAKGSVGSSGHNAQVFEYSVR